MRTRPVGYYDSDSISALGTYDVSTPADRTAGYRRIIDRHGRESLERMALEPYRFRPKAPMGRPVKGKHLRLMDIDKKEKFLQLSLEGKGRNQAILAMGVSLRVLNESLQADPEFREKLQMIEAARDEEVDETLYLLAKVPDVPPGQLSAIQTIKRGRDRRYEFIQNMKIRKIELEKLNGMTAPQAIASAHMTAEIIASVKQALGSDAAKLPPGTTPFDAEIERLETAEGHDDENSLLED